MLCKTLFRSNTDIFQEKMPRRGAKGLLPHALGEGSCKEIMCTVKFLHNNLVILCRCYAGAFWLFTESQRRS